MGVYTFVCKKSGNEWCAKQHEGKLEGSADNTFDLQRKLVKTALNSGDYGSIQSSFSYVTPASAVFQVIVGGAISYASSGGGAAAAAPAGGAAAAAEPAKEEKKEDKEESDEDMGFGLFD